jgi:hypothetical protein
MNTAYEALGSTIDQINEKLTNLGSVGYKSGMESVTEAIN